MARDEIGRHIDALAERVVPAGEFKTNCLRLMDEVYESGTEIVVTKRRRAVVRVSAVREGRPRLVGSCVGQLEFLAEIDSESAIPTEDWDMIARPEQVLESDPSQ